LRGSYASGVPQTKFYDYFGRYQASFARQVTGLSAKSLLHAGGPDAADAWDSKLRVKPASWQSPKRIYLVSSAGPDKRFDTVDDLMVYIEVRTGKVVGPPGSGSLDVEIEHDRGPFNGVAEITGSVVDPTGAIIPGAVVSVREISTGKTRTATARGDGRFTLSAVPAGEYAVQVAHPGFRIVSGKLTLNMAIGQCSPRSWMSAPCPKRWWSWLECPALLSALVLAVASAAV
jgi:Carboxypeptidase regulatory-like domain